MVVDQAAPAGHHRVRVTQPNAHHVGILVELLSTSAADVHDYIVSNCANNRVIVVVIHHFQLTHHPVSFS